MINEKKLLNPFVVTAEGDRKSLISGANSAKKTLNDRDIIINIEESTHTQNI